MRERFLTKFDDSQEFWEAFNKGFLNYPSVNFVNQSELYYRSLSGYDFMATYDLSLKEDPNEPNFIKELPYTTSSIVVNGKEALSWLPEKEFDVSLVIEERNGSIFITPRPTLLRKDYNNIWVNSNPYYVEISINCVQPFSYLHLIGGVFNEETGEFSDWAENSISFGSSPIELLDDHFELIQDPNTGEEYLITSYGPFIIVKLSETSYKFYFSLGSSGGILNDLIVIPSNSDDIYEAVNKDNYNSFNPSVRVKYPKSAEFKMNDDTTLTGLYQVIYTFDSEGDAGHFQPSDCVTDIVVSSNTVVSSVYLMGGKNLKRLELNNYCNLVGVRSEKLETIVLSKEFYYLEDYLFQDCFSLKTITCKRLTPPECGPDSENNIFYGVNLDQITVYVPKGCIPAYKEAPVWRKFKNIEEINY